MSRFSTSLLFKTGLLLATTLATIPTRLHAETNPQHSLIHTQTAPQPPSPANSLPASKNVSQQLLTPKPAPSESTTSKPVSGNNAIPTTKPSADTPKPAVTATTSEPPLVNVVTLLLKLKEKKVYVYKGDKLVTKYPVAIGKKGWETPTGEWQVMEKIKNPAWTSFKTGEVFAPGTENPLGARWIGFWTDGQDVIGFHGTANVKSIGTAASHGCVRMRNRDVKALFPLVKVGTTVKVVNE